MGKVFKIFISLMKYTTLIAIAALLSGSEAHRLTTHFAPPAGGPYASDTDHLSSECYGADEDDIMYDVFERYRVEEKNPFGAGTGIWKLPKNSGPQWSADVIRRFHVMKEDKIDEYVAANFDNFWKKYYNNGTGEIYESEAETHQSSPWSKQQIQTCRGCPLRHGLRRPDDPEILLRCRYHCILPQIPN